MPTSQTDSKATTRPLIQTWVLAARPKTLWAAVAPVLVGTAMAFEAGAHHWASAFFALMAAMLIQIGTNFSNDYLDYLKGADSTDRKGPLRVTQAGLISPATMRRATFLAFSLAFAAGIYLIYRGGLPVLIIGVVSIIAGVLYTAGRFSLAYLGLGDIAVVIFFGPVAVAGTFYVQALTVTPLVIVAGLGPGLLAAAILLVNNVRDVEEDRVADKRTLVVRMGRSFGVNMYRGCFLLAGFLPAAIAITTGEQLGLLMTLAVIPVGLEMARRLERRKDPALLNQLLGSTSQVLLLYCLIFSIGWIL